MITAVGRPTLTPLVPLPGAHFIMGSDAFYPDEGPVHEVEVKDFALEQHPVTNRQFAAFVADTGHLTVAERPLDAPEFAHLPAEDRLPGALVFRPTAGPVDLRDWRQWWHWVPGASWRHPAGPSSGIEGRADHPVVQVAQPDALAYAAWAGRRLPTEAEWEYAAGGGRRTTYAWGDDLRPDGRLMANTWQGAFPYRNTGADGWVGTSPVGTFPADRNGFEDLIGNVWEWTSTAYANRHTAATAACCGPSAAPGTSPGSGMIVLKGGSHLCAPEYCLRYRPAARSPQSADTSTTHIGFRCAV